MSEVRCSYIRDDIHRTLMSKRVKEAMSLISEERKQDIRRRAQETRKINAQPRVKMGEDRPCLFCGKLKYVFPMRFNRRTFCNQKCYMAYRFQFQNGRAYLTKENPFQGKKHSGESIDKFRVSIKKHYKEHGSASLGKPRLDMIGDKNPNWSGGNTLRVDTPEWKKLSEKIKEKYGYLCCICKRKKFLNVHHIVPYRICKSNEENNLIPLCSECHAIIERRTLRYLKLSHPLFGLGLPADFFHLFDDEMQRRWRDIQRNEKPSDPKNSWGWGSIGVRFTPENPRTDEEVSRDDAKMSPGDPRRYFPPHWRFNVNRLS